MQNHSSAFVTSWRPPYFCRYVVISPVIRPVRHQPLKAPCAHLIIRVLQNWLIDWMNHLIWQKVIYSSLHKLGRGVDTFFFFFFQKVWFQEPLVDGARVFVKEDKRQSTISSFSLSLRGNVSLLIAVYFLFSFFVINGNSCLDALRLRSVNVLWFNLQVI